MNTAPRWIWVSALILPMTPDPVAANHHEGGHHGGHWHNGGGHPYFGTGFYPTYFGAPIFLVTAPPPIFLVAGPTPPAFPMWPGPVAGPNLPNPAPPAANAAPRPRKSDPTRAEHLVELGDHLFRSGNLSRALDRFKQAARADPAMASPHIRMAQVALVRGKYLEAAESFRQAESAQPGWLAKARDIQSLYAEPADFARQVSKLETYLQAHPDDRDAWLVLGANWYLSGRTRKAADVFLRLTDRKVDSTLAAFLDASNSGEPPPRN